MAGGSARLADIAPVQDEPVVGVVAEPFGHEPRQALLDCAHRATRGQAQAIGDPEDVGVDGDGRLPEGGVQDDVRGLASDAGQGL